MHRRAFLLSAAAAFASPALASEPRRRSGGQTFVQLPSLTANVRRGAGGRRGILTVDVGLDVPDARLLARAESLVPRLRADLFAFLQTYAAGLRPGEPPNPDVLSTRFQAIVDRTLGARGARVLIGAMLLN